MQEKRHIFDSKKNVKRVLKALVVACVLTAGADIVYHLSLIHL